MTSHNQSKLAGQLISVFAVLDHWLDWDEETLKTSNSTFSPLESLQHIYVCNQYLLGNTDDYSVGDHICIDTNSMNLFEPEQNRALLRSLRASISKRFAEYKKITADTTGSLREKLRDQLYQCLCLLDIEHNDNKMLKSKNQNTQTGKIIQLILCNGLEHIKEHSNMLEKGIILSN